MIKKCTFCKAYTLLKTYWHFDSSSFDSQYTIESPSSQFLCTAGRQWNGNVISDVFYFM